MFKKLMFGAGMLLMITPLFGQEDSTKTRETVPVQLSFIYPMGTNGLMSKNTMNYFSFNVLCGVNGGLKGIEFGGLVNVNLGDVWGVQFAGISNINKATATGVLFGGIANVVGDSSNAVVFGGITNILGGNANGLHFAGISNVVNGNVMGGQFGGITNTVNGNMIGGQFAGISNVLNGDLTGVQMSGITNVVNGKLNGAQFGLINGVKTLNGFQLGLINVADSVAHGAPLGLISFVRKGYHALELSANEAIYANASFKMGVDQLYTIYKVGATQNQGETFWSYGLGIGGKYRLTDHFSAGVDLTANHLLRPNELPELQLLSRLDASLRYGLGKYVEVFAGPSFSTYVYEFGSDGSVLPVGVPELSYTENWWNNNGATSLWIGGSAGVSVRF